jgi:HEAT repeat protein
LVDRFGGEITPVLVRTLQTKSYDAEARRQLAEVLRRIAEPKHEAMLLQLLDDPDAGVVSQVLQAMAHVSSSRSVDKLAAYLSHPSRDVRALLARALGAIGAPAASAPLAKRLASEGDGWCRDEIQRALDRIASHSELSRVVQTALGGEAIGLVAVIDGLESLERAGLAKAISPLAKAQPDVWESCLRTIREHREAAAAPLLIELLASRAAATRSEAVKLLRRLTGRSEGFVPDGPAADRQAAQERWRAFFAATQRMR